ncbi:MAG: AraC family transcriptional regulator [Comamonadaceae bacterium]|nr:MAG: AraC family transcriptional regulator [Comamonadaceae bacterium]
MLRPAAAPPPRAPQIPQIPQISRKIVASPSRHVQLALVDVAGPAHEIEPQPYLRISFNIGPGYSIDVSGPEGRSVFHCRRHSLMVIPADTAFVHHTATPRPAGRVHRPARLATFRISGELVQECAIGLGLPPRDAVLRHHVLAGDDVLRGLAQGLLADLQAGCPDGALATERAAAVLVGRVLLRQKRDAANDVALIDDAMTLVAGYIDANLQQPLALEDLAGIAGLSVFHFCRVFRERLGATPHQYILARRMALARRLLWARGEAARGSVLDVALACGFASPSHFSAQFKRSTGQTPSQWQRSAAGGSPPQS